MGNYTSKLFSHNEHDNKLKIETQMKMSAIEKNEMCTPVMSKKELVDPRSATVGIARTPIEIISTPGLTRRVASAIPKYLQGKKYLETDLDAVLPAVTPEKRIPDPRSPNVAQQRTPITVKAVTDYLSPIVKVIQGPDTETPNGSDPRSPAVNFDRTPIAKSKPVEQATQDTKEQETHIRMSYCETVGDMNITEIHALPRIVTTVSKNLEERIKFSESENSEEKTDEPEEESYSENSDESEAEDQITVIPNLKAMSASMEAKLNYTFDEVSETIPEEDVTDLENPLNIEEAVKPKTEEEKSRIRVWRDSMSSLPPVNFQKESPQRPEEIMIEFDDEVVVKTAKIEVAKSNIRVEDKIKVQAVKPPVKKVLAAKKEFKGIAEDNRAPLANRSNNKSEITNKSPQQVLRTKGLSIKAGQQENTPPNTKRFRSKTKVNGAQWDPDMTVVI